MKDKNVIELMDIESRVKTVNITIEGTTDLVLNKMNSRNTRALTAEDRKKIRETPNVWEDIITAIHWRDGIPVKDTYTECTEELFKKMLTIVAIMIPINAIIRILPMDVRSILIK